MKHLKQFEFTLVLTVFALFIATNVNAIEISVKNGSLSDAVTAAVSAGASKLIVDSDVTLTANVTIPSTLTVDVLPGVTITTTGYTLTTNGTFINSGTIDGTGTVVTNGSFNNYGSISANPTVTINGDFFCRWGGLMSNNITFGDGSVPHAYAEWWDVDGTADQVQIQYAMDAALRCQLLSNDYSTNDSIEFKVDGQRLLGMGIREGGASLGTSIQFDYSITGTPIFKVSNHYGVIKDLRAYYSSLPPNTDTEALVISFVDDYSNSAWCHFENLQLDTCYGGIGFESGYAGNWFNNVFTNVTVRNWTGWAVENSTSDSGNVWNNLYVNNNWDRGSGVTASPCIGMVKFQGEGEQVFNMLNAEHAECSDQFPLRFNSGRFTINGLHTEDIYSSDSDPVLLSTGGTRASILINQWTLNSVTADASNNSYAILNTYGSGVFVKVNGITVISDCDFSGVTGSVYWLYLRSSVDLASGAFVEITGANDGSGDIDSILTQEAAQDIPVLKRFNNKIYNYIYRTASVADDAADSFTLPMTDGLMSVQALNSIADSGSLFFRADATAETALVGGGADFEVTTGALAGTTGNDNKVTVSTHTDGKMYVENRSGGALVFYFKYLSGIN